MPGTNPPFVRVVVINFDGGAVTLRCLDALLATDYPRDRLEIVLVDNASVDGLNWVIKEQYPDIVLVESDVNEGFARGCNLGIGDLAGVDMIALVNNDAIVQPDWLRRLQQDFVDDRVGAVVPKLLLNIQARTVLFRPERLDTDEDGRSVGVRVDSAVLNGDGQGLGDGPLIRYDERFWPDDNVTKAPLASLWWGSAPDAPADHLQLQLSSRAPMSVTLGEPGHEQTVAVGPEPVTVDLTLTTCRRIVNSAGGALYAGWHGGDRGFMEPDLGQYDEPAEVFAWCGGAALLRATYLRDVGLFDPTYFLYYEDFDLSWRGRSAGWTYRYEPTAVVFHEHAYSSGAGSDFFNYWVDRNRRLTLLKNAPAPVAARAVLGSPVRFSRWFLRHSLNQARRLRPPSPRLVRKEVIAYWRFARAVPRALRERRRIARAEHGVACLDRRLDGAQVKVGVYNLYWTTFGGGEQQAGGIADALCGEHEVELLGPETVDLQVLRDRLGLRLDGVTFRRIPADDLSATLASADYDLFFNHTYRSTAPNLARHGVYFVMFPHPFRGSAVHRGARRVAAAAAAPVRVVAGVHPVTDAGGAVVEGPVLLHVEKGVRSLRVEFDAGEPEAIQVGIVRRGATMRTEQLSGPTVVEVALSAEPTGPDGHDVLFGTASRKESSLRLIGLTVDGHRVEPAPRSLRQRLVHMRPEAFLDTYDTVVALSEYTLGWTRKWWGRGEEVLSPPVKMRTPGDKEQLIVAVGRFFDQRSGHSKQQLELVRAFRELVDHGLIGWRFMLVGGCNPADREYAMAVRREARGLPVEVHLNAPGTFLDEQIAKATFLWHAAGLGADLDAHPDRAEHFGIAPVEAMSAGVVPIVFAAAGPTEVVQHGINGLHFHSAEELVRQTLDLIADPSRRTRLAVAAVERANEYDSAHFEAHVRDLVAKIAT